ncbi:hypothetical protein FOL46_001213 [Perkinsus olseni]|nr:hypothetical protein FOL46_001213 [Perkinsus olseni]
MAPPPSIPTTGLLSRTMIPQQLGTAGSFSSGSGLLAPSFSIHNVITQTALSQKEISEAIAKLQGWWISGSGSGTYYFVAQDGNIHCYKQEKVSPGDIMPAGSKRLVRQERCIQLRVVRGPDRQPQVWAGPLKFERSEGGRVVWTGSDHRGPKQFTWQRIRNPTDQSSQPSSALRAPSPTPPSPPDLPHAASPTPAIKRHAEAASDQLHSTPLRRQSCSSAIRSGSFEGARCHRRLSAEITTTVTPVDLKSKELPSCGASSESTHNLREVYSTAVSTAQSTPIGSHAEAASVKGHPGSLDMNVIEDGLKTRRNSVVDTFPTKVDLDKHSTVELPRGASGSETDLLSTRTDPSRAACMQTCSCPNSSQVADSLKSFMEEVRTELNAQRDLIHTIQEEARDAVEKLRAELRQSQLDPEGLTRLLDDLDNREAEVHDMGKSTMALQSQVLALGQDVRIIRSDMGRLRDRLLVTDAASLRLERVASIGPLSDISSSRGPLTPPHASSDTVRIDQTESRSDTEWGAPPGKEAAYQAGPTEEAGSVAETLEWDSDIDSLDET